MGNTLKIVDLFKGIKKYWYILIACCLIGVGGAYLVTKITVKPVYYATTDILIHPGSDDESNSLKVDAAANSVYINTFKDMILGQIVLTDVQKAIQEKFDKKYSQEELLDMMEVAQTKDSQLFRIVGKGEDQELAKFVSDEATKAFLEKAKNMEIETGLEVAAPATEITSEMNISPKLILLLGLVIGGIVGIVIVLLKYFSSIK